MKEWVQKQTKWNIVAIAVSILRMIWMIKKHDESDSVFGLGMKGADDMLSGKTLITTDTSLEAIKRNPRKNAIDEFAERLKERIAGMQMVELQGEDVCPCAETGEECPYINQDIGCQYCARELTIKEIDEIASQMKGEKE